MRQIRVLVLCVALAAIGYGVWMESWPVYWRGEESPVVYSGPEFLAACSVDRFLRDDSGELVDRRSLAAVAVQVEEEVDLDGDTPPPGAALLDAVALPSSAKVVTEEEDCPT